MNSINPKEYLQRKQQEYENKSELLEQKETIFTRQYNQIYTTRLEQMRPRLIDPCKKWNVDYKPKLVNISLDQTCFLIGTIYMDMPLKPNVLDEITREQWVNAPPPKNKYTSDQDQVILEDESGRVVLSGEKLKQELLTTGMVIGVLGSECKDGSFCVMDIMYPTCDPQPPLHENGSWIAIVSGLHLSKKQDVRLQLLSDYITGELGSMSVRFQLT
jgi:DNA polymerase delta subunit 2